MASPNPFWFDSTDLWASHLAGQADFPDERLNTRFSLILKVLADKPLDSIPQATANAGQAKALYRFLANPRLDIADFLQPIADATVDVCRGAKCILAIQDSTSANYTTLRTTRGLGTLNNTDALGVHVHTTIAATLQGIACGMLHQTFWTRPPNAPAKDGNHKQRPIEDKESSKWLEGIAAAEAAVEGLPPERHVRLVHVFDREGDIHEVLQRISDSPHGGVIRAGQNRSVAGPVDKAFAAVAAVPVLGRRVIEVPARSGVRKRRARLEFRSVTLTITPSSFSGYKHRTPVTWTLVEAWEVNAPSTVEPLHWLLWTTEPAQTLAQVLEIVRIYKLRWLIEDFHLTLKSGCQIEELCLDTAERLMKAIVLYSSVALRILALRDLARRHPDAPCDTILDTDQWQALYSHLEHQPPTPDTPVPTIRQAVLWIGRLGGHLNRRGDRLPGVRTLWRGWRDLALLVAGYRAARRR